VIITDGWEHREASILATGVPTGGTPGGSLSTSDLPPICCAGNQFLHVNEVVKVLGGLDPKAIVCHPTTSDKAHAAAEQMGLGHVNGVGYDTLAQWTANACLDSPRRRCRGPMIWLCPLLRRFERGSEVRQPHASLPHVGTDSARPRLADSIRNGRLSERRADVS
jgi:hypothetical protein